MWHRVLTITPNLKTPEEAGPGDSSILSGVGSDAQPTVLVAS